MPELPEVETVRRTLETLIVGKTIAHVDLYYPKMVLSDCLALIQNLQGQTINKILRYGKYLFFDVNKGYLVSHLRMEGKYYYYPASTEKAKHVHAIIRFSDDSELHYHDTRKFGTWEWLETSKYELYLQRHHLGKEPFLLEANSLYLYERIKHSKRPIKAILLDQSILTGLGNIYVDEVLFLAKVHPATRACDLAKYETQLITQASQAVLAKAIDLGGTTVRSYVSSLGVSGRFQNELHVHLRNQQPCLICETPIIKTKVATRGTYVCPACQINRQTPLRVIGMTGGIASGKSLVEGMLTEAQVEVINADFIYKQLTNIGSLLYNDIVSEFGKSILLDNQAIDFKALGKIVFQDETKRLRLNQISHPLVRLEIIRILQAKKATSSLFVVSVPLLYEAKYEDLFDQVIVVYATQADQIKRLMSRNQLSKEEALQRIGAQDSLEVKIAKADVVFDNHGSITKTKKQVHQWLESVRGTHHG